MEQKTGLRHNSIQLQWYNLLCGFLHRWRFAVVAETTATTEAHLWALTLVYGWSSGASCLAAGGHVRKQHVFRVVTVCACLFAVLTPVVFGVWQPEYSHVRDYISLLGAKDSPYATWVNWCGFLPIGLLVAVVCFFLPTILPRSRLLRVGSLCLLSVSVGYLGAVLAPCDRGCPPTGSISQEIHNVLGLIEYGGAAIGLVLCAGALLRRPEWQSVGWLTLLTAAVVVVCLTFLLTPSLQPWRGLWQRVAECAIFAWFFIIAVVA